MVIRKKGENSLKINLKGEARGEREKMKVYLETFCVQSFLFGDLFSCAHVPLACFNKENSCVGCWQRSSHFFSKILRFKKF